MPEIIRKPNTFKKNLFERTPEGKPIEKLKMNSATIKKLILDEKINPKRKVTLNEIENYKTKNNFNAYHLTSAKYLAKEVYITSAFINRLSKLTKRKIIVVPIISNGPLYTSFIKENQKVKIKPLHFPSTNESNTPQHKLELERILNQNKGSLFVFIDSSTSRRMPSSLTGHIANFQSYLSATESIKGILESKNYNVKTASYKYAANDEYNANYDKKMLEANKQPNSYVLQSDLFYQNHLRSKDYLPKYNSTELNKINAILFNPTKERNHVMRIKDKIYKWESAPHDDSSRMHTKEFQNIILHFANNMKTSYEKRLKSEPKRK